MVKLDITFQSNFDFDIDDVFTRTFYFDQKSVYDIAIIFTIIKANVKKGYRITKMMWNGKELSVFTEGEKFGYMQRL